tara:strand:+ start:128 stop:730 length:603 start_codon:yes stop_codon:yes gene_type:complete
MYVYVYIETLCKFLIIVTTHKRLSVEWKKRGPQDSSYSNMMILHPSSKDTHQINRDISPLLRMVFYRVAFDEGHSMGKSNLTNSLLMATSLYAKNRWLLTGTPTPSDTSQSLPYLFHQFDFLLHPILFTMNRNKTTNRKGNVNINDKDKDKDKDDENDKDSDSENNDNEGNCADIPAEGNGLASSSSMNTFLAFNTSFLT